MAAVPPHRPPTVRRPAVRRPAPLLLAALALLGCKRGGEDCPARAEELGRFLTSMDHDMSLVALDEGLEPVRRDDLAPLEPALSPVVQVRPDAITFQGDRVADAAELGVRLAEARAGAEEVAEMTPERERGALRRLHLVLDRRTTWDTAVQVTDAAREAGYTEVIFVFARPPATPPPPRSAVDDELDRALQKDSSERATEAARIAERIVKGCAAIERLFGSVASTPGEDKAARLLAGVGPALVECDCAVDIPALRSVLWRIAGNPRPLSAVTVELAPDAPPITLPAATTWEKAAARLQRGAGRTRLAVGGAS